MGLHALSDLECIRARTPYPRARTEAQWQLRAPLIPLAPHGRSAGARPRHAVCAAQRRHRAGPAP